MTGRGRAGARLVVAALLALSAILGSFEVSSAAPSKGQVQAAKAKLDSLNRNLDQLIELYNQAHVALDQAQAGLVDAQQQMARADAAAQRAQDALAEQAVAAYTGMGSQLNILLGANSLNDFTDRLQFVGAIAQSDADLATKAQTTGQRAQWAANEYQNAVAAHRARVNDLLSQKSNVQSALVQQQSLYQQLNQSYQDALAAQRAAAQLAAAVASGSTYSSTPNPSGTFVPPPNAGAADVAIAAARSVIGTQYVWGSADPSIGFDCSGLVMWSYAQAGIYLPHSSEMMYAMLPHLSQSELVPGDLLFFYTPVSHVGIYLGGSEMIDASHPGPGGEVAVRSIYWQYFVGGGRIG